MTTAEPDAPGRRASSRRTGPWILGVLCLGIGLAVTGVAVRAEQRSSDRSEQRRLDQLAGSRADALATAVDDDLAVLQAAAAFQADNHHDRATFEAFTGRLALDDHPGLEYLSFAVPVLPDEVPALERERREAGHLGFQVSPGPDDGRLHVVLFSGPTPGNTDGVDLGQVEGITEVLDRAAATGLAQVTEPFLRIQDRALPEEERLLSVGLYVPVYRAGAPTATPDQRADALLGWVITAIPVQTLLADVVAPETDDIRVQVSDADDPDLVVAALPALDPPSGAATASAVVPVAGQRWRVTVASLEPTPGSAAPAIAVAGALASVALGALAFTRSRQRSLLAEQARVAVAEAESSQRRFRAAFDHAPLGMVVVSHDGTILDVNPAMARMVGQPWPRHRSLAESALPEDLPRMAENVERLRGGEVDHLVVERRLVRADGSTFWARITSAPLPDDEAMVGMVQDISHERAAAEAAEALRSRQARFEALVRNSSDLITVVGADGNVLYASPAVGILLGRAADDVVGHPALDVVHPDDRDRVAAGLEGAMAAPGTHGPIRYRMLAADGSVRVVEAIGTNLLDDPDVGGVVANCRDVTAQEEAAEALRQRAYRDPLTGLATRDVLIEQLDNALGTARISNATVALLFVDLDRFKQVNDRFGHAAGDTLLRSVAVSLTEAVRPGDMVARHGGDEFVVLLESVRDVREARTVAERVRMGLRRPVEVADGVLVEPGASVGVALGDGSTTAEAMLRDADAALYRAKQHGRDRVEVFDDELRQSALRRLDTELVLRQALEDDDVSLRFEPVADLVAGVVVGAEARVRLALPSGEFIPQSELLPVAQESGLASRLAADALEAACRAAAAWSPDGEGRWVGLDVSAAEVTHPSFIERLAEVLAATGIGDGLLRLELPVEVVTHGSALTRRAIAAARALGVRVVLDGVGAELRALAALGGFGVDGLKLDLASLPDLVGDPVAAAVAAAAGEVAGAAGLPVVVVGADRPEQVEAVRALGFRYVQGAAVAPILSADDLLDLV